MVLCVLAAGFCVMLHYEFTLIIVLLLGHAPPSEVFALGK